jgi:predicted alpha/beta hydrolase family esterase
MDMQKQHIIVPGVGGSDQHHWQTWLQGQLPNASRVEQAAWHHPVLSHWVEHFVSHLQTLTAPAQVIAHSFGCLTAVAALDQYPALNSKIESVLLVAPANPRRFAPLGFAQDTGQDFAAYFATIRLAPKSLIVYSENDPWHDTASTLRYAQAWGSQLINQGAAGHINVASGFGAWP